MDQHQHPVILNESVATTDLATLRHWLLDLFCQLAYKEGDFGRLLLAM
jgi:orotate phosphoribosyltransferase